MPVQPFQINIPQPVLDDLQTRLARTRWTDEVPNSGWSYGANLAYLQSLISYWQTQYNWRTHETSLNQFSHFKTEIDGITLHFIHQRGTGSNPKPLLLTHGWPDSFYRFHKLIPLLTNPTTDGIGAAATFDVIVPSLPGFAFSDRHALPAASVADLWQKLMTQELSYSQYYAAGGDLGAGVTLALASKYPASVRAIHLTDVGFPSGIEDQSSFSPPEREFAAKCQQWWFTEGAYNALQSTKPQTIASALNDSPVGLAAWIVEKLYAWSDDHGDLETRWTKDELLTNLMLYWVTETIGSSFRMYLENMRATYAAAHAPQPAPQTVPAAVAVFPGDTVPLPREWAARRVNLQRFTPMPRGGHFAAFEDPALFAADLRAFFTQT